MKALKKKYRLLLLVITIVSSPSISFSQQWSTEQQEAWKVCEKLLKFWAERDLEGFMSCQHENYTGWFGDDPFPEDKNASRNWESYNFSHQKIHHYETKPISITITDNVAIVNYYLTARREDENGNKITHSKLTEILLKENGKWLILGTHAVRVNEG
jgi:hypothetical protein